MRQGFIGGRGLMLAAVALLAGCAGTPSPPLAFEVKDAGVMASDLALCRAHAAAGRQSLSIASIGTAGAKAGLATAPTAAVNPLAPVIGGLAGASGEALNEMNLLGQSERRQVVHCMERKGDSSRAYFILDPND